MACSNSRSWRTTALLFGRGPPSGAAVRLPERPAAAATGQAAGGDDRDAIAGGGAVHPPVGTDGAPGGLADDLAAGDDDRVAAGARTRHADGVDDPGAIEIVAAASAALAPGAARFVRLGLAASRRFRGLARTRTRQRFFIVADAAARAAGLRMGKAGAARQRDRQGKDRDRTSDGMLHEQVLPIS